MKYYAEYYHTGTTGQIIPACGSDAHKRLDGRLSILRMHNEAIAHANRLKAIHPGWTGYRLIRGQSLLTAQPITPDTGL